MLSHLSHSAAMENGKVWNTFALLFVPKYMGKARHLGVVQDIDLVSVADVNELPRSHGYQFRDLFLGLHCHALAFILVNNMSMTAMSQSSLFYSVFQCAFVMEHQNCINKLRSMGHIGLLHPFVKKVLLKHSHAHLLLLIYSSFCTTKTELNSCNRNCTINKI